MPQLSIEQIITAAQEKRASDIHIVCGLPVRLRIDGSLHDLNDTVLTGEDCEYYARSLSSNYDEIARIGEQGFAHTFSNGSRCRVSLFRQQGYVSAAIRLLSDHIPTFEELNLPPVTRSFANFRHGVVLITGETGSGKSTTLATLLNSINISKSKHIITLEDPIEYIHKPDRCIINQREVGLDTRSYQDGLNAILREDPDIILVGEMRTMETIETVLMAAETGHLVFATLHTNSAADTVDRIVNAFPADRHPQVRMQLSSTLQAVMCQQLLPHMSGKGRVMAAEIMIANGAIRNLIREGKSTQIANAISTSADIGNILMDNSLVTLYRQRKISAETAMYASHDRDALRRTLQF